MMRLCGVARSGFGAWLWVMATLAGPAGAAVGDAQIPIQQLLQTAAYVGVDYRGAVASGVVTNASEYAEMVEFATTLAHGIAGLPSSSASAALTSDAQALVNIIGQKGDATAVKSITDRIQVRLLQSYPIPVLPQEVPDLTLGGTLYAQQCAACHGSDGRGDGPSAAALQPHPTDFRDRDGAEQRSLYGLYNTITIGVANTAMRPFAELSAHERWSIAFFVSRLNDGVAGAAEEAAWNSQRDKQTPGNLIVANDSDLRAATGSAGALIWLRAHPDLLFAESTRDRGLALTRTLMQSSLQRWEAGDRAQAYQLALSAYLDGFEPIEPTLAGVDESLMRETERALMAYRGALQSDGDSLTVISSQHQALRLLDASEQALHAGSLGASVTFASSFIILAREGLEAILLLAAMLVFIRRLAEGEQRRRASIAIHWGWIVALLAGFATWTVSNWVVQISGATRELTEGATALIAAAVLIWVALWMHGQVAAHEWSGFVTGRLEGALHQRSRWLLFGLAFLAMYREVFETVLFYQALWLQIGIGGRTAMIGGIVAAVGFLLLALWAILRAGATLPIRQFFTICAYTVLLLAVIFTGKGVVALQESGVIAQTLVSIPTIGVLGVYPSLQSIGAQLTVLLITLVLLWRQRRPAGGPSSDD